MSHVVPTILGILGGTAVAAAVAGGGYLAYRRAEGTKSAATEAVKVGGTFRARLTGYWPYSAKASEKKMEGGKNDRKGHPLHTLEQHRANPVAHPYVSVSGDDAVFPYGQRVNLDAWPGMVFRVVDTGGHFRGMGKVYRVFGAEPLDVAVDSSKTVVPKDAIATIVPGDNFAYGKAVAASGFKGQTVSVGGGALSTRTSPAWHLLGMQARRQRREVLACAA